MVTKHALSMTNSRGVPWWKNNPMNGRLMGFFASSWVPTNNQECSRKLNVVVSLNDNVAEVCESLGGLVAA